MGTWDHDQKKNLTKNSEGDYLACLKECVVSIIEFFQANIGAQKLILENTVSPPILSSDLHEIAETILQHIEQSVGLPNMFNKSGVFLVVTQIIVSILSLALQAPHICKHTCIALRHAMAQVT